MKWILLIIKSTNVSSRDRMFIWRNIKNTGAVSLSHSVYILHDTEDNRATAIDIARIAHERKGEVLQFFADTLNEDQEQKLNKLIAEEIATEIKEFSKECEDFIDDITKRISNKKIKIFELEELSDDIHKLDRWRIKIFQKHGLDAPKIEILNKEIGKCKEKLNEFEGKILQMNKMMGGRELVGGDK
ncbi:MAG TPA: Chromate resistance protein ChrB [Candidatus Methanoperedens sp.]